MLEQYARSRLVAEEGDFKKEFAFRDRAMADNVHALLDAEGAGARAVLWAHNGHVQRSAYFGLSNMGGFLHAAAGAEPVVIGFAFNQGSFQAMGVIDGDYKLGTHVVGPAPDGLGRRHAGGHRHSAVCARPAARAGRRRGRQVDGGQAVAAHDRSGVRAQGRA